MISKRRDIVKNSEEEELKEIEFDKRYLEFLKLLVRYLNKTPILNLSTIAREANVSVATAWRLFHLRFGRKGIELRVEPCYPNLRLRPFVFIVKSTKNLLEEDIPYALATYRAYKGFRGYLVFSAVPEEYLSQVEDYMKKLGQVVEYYELDRHLVTDISFDFYLTKELPSEVPIYQTPLKRVDFDDLDLRILATMQELQLYPSKIASKLGGNKKTIEYRIKRRVKFLIEGFRAYFPPRIDKEKFTYAYIVRGSNKEFPRISCLPFIKTAISGRSTLFAIASVPHEYKRLFLDLLSDIGEWIEIYLGEFKEKPVPYEYFDSSAKTWKPF
ncbi:MAG: hypothetical protein DRN04_08680 [Thermoprotei archaeon]|nr:MAG: hypothetical protein DRN04_08680 [Thermoprotei archaeon]